MRTNPPVKLHIYGPNQEETYETVEGTHPRGAPKWLAVTPPPARDRTVTGRVPPGMWSVTHVPTGLRLIGGLKRADATLAARAIGRDMPFLADIDEQITDTSRDPYRSGLELVYKIGDLLRSKADDIQRVNSRSRYGRRAAVQRLGELAYHDLLLREEMAKLPPEVQVEIDAWLMEQPPRQAIEEPVEENPPAADCVPLIVDALAPFLGRRIDAHLAIEVAPVLAEALELGDEDLEDLANGMMVREGMVLDVAIARERANNLAMAFGDW